MVNPVSESQARVVAIALPVAKALLPKAPGAEQIRELLKTAKASLENGDTKVAFMTVIQAAATVFRVHADLYLQALDFEKESIDKDLGHKGEWIAREAGQLALQADDSQTEALSLVLAADAAICNGDGRKAEKAATAAVEAFQRLGDKWGQASALHSLVTAKILRFGRAGYPKLSLALKSEQKMDAQYKRKLKELDPALQAARDVSEIYSSLGQPRFEAAALTQVVEVLIARGETLEAKRVARDVCDIFDDLDDTAGKAAATKLILKANLCKAEDYVDAIFAAKHVIKTLKGRDKVFDDEKKRALAQAYFALAKTHINLKESKEAIEAAEEAIRLYDDIGERSTRVKASLLQALAEAHRQMGNRADATTLLQKCLDMQKKDENRRGEAHSLHLMAKTDLEVTFAELEANSKALDESKSADLSRAWALAEQSLGMFRDLGDKDGEVLVNETVKHFTEKAKKVQKKITGGVPNHTVYIFDPDTRKVTIQERYEPPEAQKAISLR